MAVGFPSSQPPGSVSSSSSFQRSSGTQDARTQSRSGQAYTPQQQQQLNLLFPQIQQRLRGVNPQQSFASRYGQVGGTPTPFPDIPIVQSFSPGQIQQRSNQIFSQGDVRTGGEQRQLAQSAAGRGFAANSPLLAELQQAAAGRNYRTATGDVTNFELGAAEQNAGLEMQSWLARLGAAQATSGDEIRRRQLALQQQGYDVQQENALLNALNINLRPLTSAESLSTSRGRTQSQGGSVSSSVSRY